MALKPEVAEMLRVIERECEYTRAVTGIKAFQARVMAAMAEVPRREFVPESMKPFAYDNCPLPIGAGQTISQPYIVALMTDLLRPGKDDVILEVGAGSGYQAAILAKLVCRVYTVELIADLAVQARLRLQKHGCDNVEVLQGDGCQGLAAHAPYNGIIVTAAAPFIPPALAEQLKAGGRLVIPVGVPHSLQYLLLLEKHQDGRLTSRKILAVSFVPLVCGESA